ncbi:ABC transporter permease [Roseovarius nubinhibens]|uniref:Glycine betaine/proline ABC transporter, permease protein n=1 Tax=Roseovarius nubinhibens (strain ATCC BAA-591 / DSM 15170 / ISM) TaxID=89187 RepID=A3SNP5_ROSNI|nr:ABC transporter permease subunit [Roseovarius nubinhibens]EAP76085.1 glycine betaine/proline ABC transporter, permease protein [Roseovarius nubinhibens ISM]
MSAAGEGAGAVPGVTARLSRGTWAALVVLLTGALCMALAGKLPWLVKFPEAWALPMTQWVGQGMEWLLGLMKPAMRLVSAGLGVVMEAVNWLFNALPWPVLIGLVTGFGWWAGGLRLAALGGIGMSLVLASGYWTESMNTLSLVAVSVPLALIAGGAVGILAYEFPRIKGLVQGIMDVMQTVPTFAYLTPLLLLFGFGPVVGLIASAIYAAPPMARNVLLGLERVESDIKEAAIMSGGTRLQQLFLIEIPAAKTQIMVGVNQCLMAALSMVIIAAVIGGFEDIGWEVLLTMRKAQLGPSLLAGMVIVVFAVIIDRMSLHLAMTRERHDLRIAGAIAGVGVVVAILLWGRAAPGEVAVMEPAKQWLDTTLSRVLTRNAGTLDAIKNGAMFYGLLPVRIGLDGAVLPFTWGFQWTAAMSAWFLGAAALAGLALGLAGRITAGLVLLILAGVLETGVSELPWPFLLVAVAAIGWTAGGWRLAALTTGLMVLVLFSGLWQKALLSLYLAGVSVFACAVMGGLIGLASAASPMVWRVVRPICDMLQTIPLFVFLIPVLMFFQIGEFSAFLAICMYAIVPMIRYTRQGLVSTPDELIEAAISSGATSWQVMREVRAPYAAPTILLGLNQTILYAFAMLVIAALVGTTGLGQSIFLALGQADVGLGIVSGAAMAILALVADRLVQGFATKRRAALGL